MVGTEIPRLAQRYQVRAVPRAAVGKTVSTAKALPDPEFMKAVVAARKS
jgi:hypothetical protein